MLCSAGVFCTTIHAQDFKDTEGDRIVGRKTLPIIAPVASRRMLMLALLLWSFVLSVVWNLHLVLAFVIIALGSFTGMRFVAKNSIESDQRSYYLYNVSFAATER